ncbi:hypothetical protein, partial [Gordonibacter pamelaeae]|uniref:hypothetical protein n=1 Tax=Gordonibacter pamelaeae TaxID=471189 RepID=UPI001D07BF7E
KPSLYLGQPVSVWIRIFTQQKESAIQNLFARYHCHRFLVKSVQLHVGILSALLYLQIAKILKSAFITYI